MYMGDNGASCVYVSCRILTRMYLQKEFFEGFNWSIREMVSKWDILSLHMDGEIPSKHDVLDVENHAIHLRRHG